MIGEWVREYTLTMSFLNATANLVTCGCHSTALIKLIRLENETFN